VDLVRQGKAAALHELETLLTGHADKLAETLETALREQKAT
jgi:hypothetical protein